MRLLPILALISALLVTETKGQQLKVSDLKFPDEMIWLKEKIELESKLLKSKILNSQKTIFKNMDESKNKPQLEMDKAKKFLNDKHQRLEDKLEAMSRRVESLQNALFQARRRSSENLLADPGTRVKAPESPRSQSGPRPQKQLSGILDAIFFLNHTNAAEFSTIRLASQELSRVTTKLSQVDSNVASLRSFVDNLQSSGKSGKIGDAGLGRVNLGFSLASFVMACLLSAAVVMIGLYVNKSRGLVRPQGQFESQSSLIDSQSQKNSDLGLGLGLGLDSDEKASASQEPDRLEIDISSVPGIPGKQLRVTCKGKITPEAKTAVRFEKGLLSGTPLGVKGTAIKRPKTSEKFRRPKTAERRRERARKEVDDIIESLDQEEALDVKTEKTTKISKLGGPSKPMKKVSRSVINEKISSLLKE